MLGQREFITDNEDCAHFFVCQILGALKTQILSSHPRPFMAASDLGAVATFIQSARIGMDLASFLQACPHPIMMSPVVANQAYN